MNPKHTDQLPEAFLDGGFSTADLPAVFAAIPGVNLLLAADSPHFTMLLASDGRLAATMTTREATLGRPLFEIFPDANPENPRAVRRREPAQLAGDGAEHSRTASDAAPAL